MEMLLPSTRPQGQRPRPWTSQPHFSPHPHTSSPFSTHAVAAPVTSPCTHIPVCTAPKHDPRRVLHTPWAARTSDARPGAQAALPSAPLCGARGEADGSGPSAGRFLPSCGAPSVSPSSRSLARVAPLSPAPWSQPPPRLRTFRQPGLSLSSSDAAEELG